MKIIFNWIFIFLFLMLLLSVIPSTREYIDNTFIPSVDSWFEEVDNFLEELDRLQRAL